MKATNPSARPDLRILAVVLFIFMTAQLMVAQSWYDDNWQYRIPLIVSNPGTNGLWDFQVNITLNASNIDVSKVKDDWSDIRFTEFDGVTLIPFWIESYTSTSASVWVKVPGIPVSGATVFLYYGCDTPTEPSTSPIETPPMGPFTRASGNPISFSNYNLLAENIVYDPVTLHYWMCLANYTDLAISLCWSDSPADPSSWTFSGNVISIPNMLSGAPHLVLYNNTWYLFYADRPNIYYATASGVAGPYTPNATPVLQPSGSVWDQFRVDEPYVLQRPDGKWIMIYMGDAKAGVGETYPHIEQIGYAFADNITGPYTPYTDNPVLKFGESGSYDAGTIADPWVYYFQGTYYIGYSVSPTDDSPWQTAMATTTDWESFTKRGVIFPVAGTGWDATNSFRGAVLRVGDNYIFTYTGGTYHMGIATQPVIQTRQDIVNNPDAVFDFYDGFDGPSLDPTKWVITDGFGEATFLSGSMTLHASPIYQIMGLTEFGLNYVMETEVRHPDQGTEGLIIGIGMRDNNWNNIRIVDDYSPLSAYWQKQAGSSSSGFLNMGQTADQGVHIFRIYRQGPVLAGHQIDGNGIELTDCSEGSPNFVDEDTYLKPFLLSYGDGNDVTIGWTRVRKWVGADPIIVIGIEQDGSLNHWTGSISTDWNTASNWSLGTVPGLTDNVSIYDVLNDPQISSTANCNNLTIEPPACLTISDGGSLTVSGTITINSAGTSNSGSLINLRSVAAGTVTYNRYLRSKAEDGDYHFFSSPIVSNQAENVGTVSAVYQWNETGGIWDPASMTNLQTGHGYNLKQVTGSDGLITFTGSLAPEEDIIIHASSPFADVWDGIEDYEYRDFATGRDFSAHWGGGGWNLLGNPYASALKVSAFINANYSTTPSENQFDPSYVALYLYNKNGYSYVSSFETGWPDGTELDEKYLQTGQGFFVLAMNNDAEFKFSRSMQGKATGVPVLKSTKVGARWPGLRLKVKSGEKLNFTTIVFNEDMTAGLDPGYDIGHFSSGSEIELYTTLVEDNGINFARQALPVNGSVKNIVPIGIDFGNGGVVTFSAETVPFRNYRFWLEDRTTGIFTDLTSNSYTVNLPSQTFGTGRFFVHTVAGLNLRPRTVTENPLEIRIWISHDRQVNIQGPVSDRAICEIFDIWGHQITKVLLKDADFNTLTLSPNLKGAFIVKVTDGIKVNTNKVVIP
jgi:hypothetical protein